MKSGEKKSFRIGLDARFYGPRGKGLGRYTKEVVDAVVRLDEINEYIVFLGRENYDEFICPSPRVRKVRADVHWYGLAEQIMMPYFIWKHHIDLMHFPHFNVPVACPVPFIVTIHDLILTKFPTTRATTLGPLLYFIKNLLYKAVISYAVKRSRAVIAVSEYTRLDIIEQFGVKPEKVRMIYEGVAELDQAEDEQFARKLEPSEVLSDYCILQPYLLYVGNAYPHKNLETLIRVFKRLNASRPDLKLVLVGKDDYFYNRLKRYAECEGVWVRAGAVTSQPVIFPGYVPDRQLEVLFARAAAYIFPSHYEGFGLPPLEAMAHGCPVASSNATCLPEVLGEAAEYFDPTDETAMRATIERVIDNETLRHRLIAAGLERVKRYSWHECGIATARLYREQRGL